MKNLEHDLKLIEKNNKQTKHLLNECTKCTIEMDKIEKLPIFWIFSKKWNKYFNMHSCYLKEAENLLSETKFLLNQYKNN